MAEVTFCAYRFDPTCGRLWFGEREIHLTPKAAAVLAALVARAGDLVTKQDLFSMVWRDASVGDDALVTCVQELRRALGDSVRTPSFIETRHRRGYRFVAPLGSALSKSSRSSRSSRLSSESPFGVPAETQAGRHIWSEWCARAVRATAADRGY